jgi:hypothetical protein
MSIIAVETRRLVALRLRKLLECDGEYNNKKGRVYGDDDSGTDTIALTYCRS